MTDERLYPRRWWALAVLCASLVIITLDNTILNVALPTLVRDLSATSSELQWIVDAYVLVFAGLLLTAGNLGDRYGRKRALNVGLLVFALGSALSAYAGSAGHLIATRALMGVGGAFIMPSTLSILTNIFPAGERRRAIAIWTATAGIGVPLGPVLGGWLLEHFWWGSIFLINLPIVAVALAAGAILIPESKDPEHSALDPVGAALSMAGLAVLLYAIIEAPSKGWASGSTLGLFVVAAVLLVAFTLWELRVPRPMLDTRLFRNPRFSGASLSVTLVFFALFGSSFFLTQYLQFVLGYGTLEAGLRIVPVALGIMVGAGSSVRLSRHIGTRFTVALGLAIVSVGFVLMSRVSITSGYGLIALTLPILGLGMGTAMAPATDSIMGAIPRANAGVGSAVNDTTRQVGGALGVAVLGSLLSTSYGSTMDNIVSALPEPAAGRARDSIGGALQVAAQLDRFSGQLLTSGARAAFIDAMGSTLLVSAAFAFSGALIALIFLPSGEPEHAPETAAAEVGVSEASPQPGRARDVADVVDVAS
jgi:EmrB/QacA subfamily drug resistance transporter